MTANQPKAPGYLTKASREWFQSIASDFELQPHHVKLLVLACETFDEVQAGRAVVRKYGATYLDSHGSPKERPENAIARQGRVLFSRLVRELGLDAEPPPSTRPPRIGGSKY